MIIANCNMAIEALNVILSTIFIALMLYTMPRKTYSFKINFIGMVLSDVHIVLHFVLVSRLNYPDQVNTPWFAALTLAYFTLYYVLLVLIFIYVDQLCYSHRSAGVNKKRLLVSALIFIPYAGINSYFLFTGNMFVITNGHVEMTPFFGSYLIFGALTAIGIFAVRFKNGYMISKVMKHAITVTIPADLVLIALQFVYHEISFVGITYIIPFMLYYILLHSHPYDEISGVQNRFALESRFMSHKNGIEHSLIGIIYIPKLEKMSMSDIDTHFSKTIASMCKYIETLAFDMRVYNIDKSTYAFYTSNTNSTDLIHIESMIRELLSAPVEIDGVQRHFEYKCVFFSELTGVTSYEIFANFSKYILDKISEFNRSLTYHVTQKDYEDFTSAVWVESVLADIYRKSDLDDERVICYVQPIFDVNTKTFRTGEALMRLCVDGKMIFPDQFIPIAEKNNYIHALTCIILNKVCKKIHLLNTKYSFDAISINCSTSEFMDPNLHDELLAIIYSNHVPCNKIRLELTESASASNYETVLHNMDVLTKAGINFYLDDFGTGYSNLSRILSLPFHTVKFDKSLLYKSIEDANVDHLFSSMAETFKNSGLLLLVEGVEDDNQSDYVIGYQFDYIQGYKYARPQDIDKFEEFLTPIENKIG